MWARRDTWLAIRIKGWGRGSIGTKSEPFSHSTSLPRLLVYVLLSVISPQWTVSLERLLPLVCTHRSGGRGECWGNSGMEKKQKKKKGVTHQDFVLSLSLSLSLSLRLSLSLSIYLSISLFSGSHSLSLSLSLSLSPSPLSLSLSISLSLSLSLSPPPPLDLSPSPASLLPAYQ